MSEPGFWQHETSGALRPAVEAYLHGHDLTPEHVAALREYLRQWIMAPVWTGPEIDRLRDGIDDLTSIRAIDRWLDRALDAGIDPL